MRKLVSLLRLSSISQQEWLDGPVKVLKLNPSVPQIYILRVKRASRQHDKQDTLLENE